MIGFPKPEDRRAEDEDAVEGESSEPAKAGDPEDAKEIA